MIVDELRQELIQAQKSSDPFKVGVLRYLLSEIKNKEIELRPLQQELTDEVVVSVLKRQVKKRNQIVEEYTKANRQDLADKESAELEVVKAYFEKYNNE